MLNHQHSSACLAKNAVKIQQTEKTFASKNNSSQWNYHQKSASSFTLIHKNHGLQLPSVLNFFKISIKDTLLTNLVKIRSGFRIFSRADFQKKWKFCRHFLSRSNWFPELSQSTIKTPFLPKLRLFVWHILENVEQKWRFFGARSPSKLVYIGAEEGLEKL